MKFFRSVCNWAGFVITTIFTFMPESAFNNKNGFTSFIAESTKLCEHNLAIIINRLILAVLVIVLVLIVLGIYTKIRRSITIKGHDYIIKVKVGDLLTEKNCKKLINFDECFSSHVGDAPEDIKPISLCGQFLLNHPDLNIDQIVRGSKLKPSKIKSRFKNRNCYRLGSIIQHDDYLLMAFAPLDKKGLAHFLSVNEYMNCLSNMWEELDKYSRQCDVCIPILGSGRTRIGSGTGYSYTVNNYINMIIWSYVLSPYKIKKPNKLQIICHKTDDLSLEKISMPEI